MRVLTVEHLRDRATAGLLRARPRGRLRRVRPPPPRLGPGGRHELRRLRGPRHPRGHRPGLRGALVSRGGGGLEGAVSLHPRGAPGLGLQGTNPGQALGELPEGNAPSLRTVKLREERQLLLLGDHLEAGCVEAPREVLRLEEAVAPVLEAAERVGRGSELGDQRHDELLRTPLIRGCAWGRGGGPLGPAPKSANADPKRIRDVRHQPSDLQGRRRCARSARLGMGWAGLRLGAGGHGLPLQRRLTQVRWDFRPTHRQ
mmetsp:Transcript_78072/g.232547  ORF Transcript_78072/g.232547 Transcript_78072/m.232547 type:complete len:258 (+) Transcript_78072:72-845(+)